MIGAEYLELDARGSGRYGLRNHGDAEQRDVVFGGQLLAQMIAAASIEEPGRVCRTIHAVFARSGRVGAETELHVETIHAGRTFASITATAYQGERLCSRAQLLLDHPDADLLRHSAAKPAVSPPDAAVDPGTPGLVFPGGELRIVDGVDTWSVDAPPGPPELQIWTRHDGAPAATTAMGAVTNQAMFAWGTDGFLIGTAMRPHPDMGQDLAHKTISTGVITHTLTFHRPFSMQNWMLTDHHSTFAGEGRTYGRAEAFTAEGVLVASYVQDNIVRAFDGAPDRPDHHRSVM